MKERRIVQFALGGDSPNAGAHRSPTGEMLYALDEEGVLWFRPLPRAHGDAEEASDVEWVALPELPARGLERGQLGTLEPRRPESAGDDDATSPPVPEERSMQSHVASPVSIDEPATSERDEPESEPNVEERTYDPERAPAPTFAEERRVAAEREADELPWIPPPLSPRTLLDEEVPRAVSPLPDPGFPGSVRPAEREDV